jgi:hypothetical protein
MMVVAVVRHPVVVVWFVVGVVQKKTSLVKENRKNINKNHTCGPKNGHRTMSVSSTFFSRLICHRVPLCLCYLLICHSLIVVVVQISNLKNMLV